MTEDPTTPRPSAASRVFEGVARLVVCRDVSGMDCDRSMLADADNCGDDTHSRTVPIDAPRGEPQFRTRREVYWRPIVVEEEYDLLPNEPAGFVEVDASTFDPEDLWVSIKVQKDFTAYHGVDAAEAITNVRLVVRLAIEKGTHWATGRGFHHFSWRGYRVEATPDLGTAVNYRTVHYERTPRQVVDGVKSRLSRRGRGAPTQKGPVPDDLKVGDVVEGMVSNVVGFGAFVNIGGFDALLHRSQCESRMLDGPEVLQVGDAIRVAVLEIDVDGRRVVLGLADDQPSG